MRLLITGHRGLLGHACLTAFKDHEIITAEGVDLRDKYTTQWFFNHHKPEGVIHCAAKVGGVKANRDFPVDFIQDNLAINANVLASAHAVNVKKLVNIATSCMYPKDAAIPVKEYSLLTGPFEPDVSAYATAKLVAYATCNAYRSQYGRDFVTVAPSNIYGENDKYGQSSHVVPALIKRLHECRRTGSPLVVWGNGSAVREFIYSLDAARAIRSVFEKWSSPELVNVGTGDGTSIKQLVEMLIDVSGVKTEVIWDESKPTGIQEKTFDVTRIKSLGWSPEISLRDGLRNTWLDYSCNPSKRTE